MIPLPIREVNGFHLNQKVLDKVTREEYLIFDWGYSDPFGNVIDRVWIDRLGEIFIICRKFDEIEAI